MKVANQLPNRASLLPSSERGPKVLFLKISEKKPLQPIYFTENSKSSISPSKALPPGFWVRTVKTNHKVCGELPRLISLKNKCYPSAKEVSWEKLLAKLQNSSLLPSASWSDSWLRFLLKNFFNTRRKEKWRQNYFVSHFDPKNYVNLRQYPSEQIFFDKDIYWMACNILMLCPFPLQNHYFYFIQRNQSSFTLQPFWNY